MQAPSAVPFHHAKHHSLHINSLMGNFTQCSLDGSLRLSLSDERNHAKKGESKIMQTIPHRERARAQMMEDKLLMYH